MTTFSNYDGDLIGLATNENHLVYRWDYPGCKILFSVTRMGGGASCHFASDKAGLRHLKTAINEFCAFVFKAYKWCKMIIANVKRLSTRRFLSKLGFIPVMEYNDHLIMVRRY